MVANTVPPPPLRRRDQALAERDPLYLEALQELDREFPAALAAPPEAPEAEAVARAMRAALDTGRPWPRTALPPVRESWTDRLAAPPARKPPPLPLVDERMIRTVWK